MGLERLTSLTIVLAITIGSVQAELCVDFEDLTLPDSESYWSGNYPSGGSGELTSFSSRGVSFNNFSDGDYAYWEGFAYSNMSDTTTPGYTNQYSAYPGTGYDGGDDIYAVGYVGDSTVPTVVFAEPTTVLGGYFTNTTYAVLAMLNGQPPAKKFGGPTGDDPDWFLLTITGKDTGGGTTGIVEFYLGDYRFADNSLDYMVDSWEFVNLASLGTVNSLELSLSSSDVGIYGMNTPKYFALDNLVVVPEPATALLLWLGGVMLAVRKLKTRC